MQKLVLVEWKYDGERRHQACQSDVELASCAWVLAGLPAVQDVVVWSTELVAHLVEMGRCGHA